MEKTQALDALSALAQQTRLDVFQLLIRYEPEGLAAGDIAEKLGVPQNTLSTHLAILVRAGLATSERRSRSIIYRAQVPTVRGLVRYLVDDCCAGHPELNRRFDCGGDTCATSAREGNAAMPDRVYNVLFLCTGNSARSILAETILNKDGAGRFRAFSAGSQPAGQVNPLAIEVLTEEGFSTEGLRSKSWDEFAAPAAPEMDFVFTVCDNAAGETCPVWPGHPMTAHWGIEDPARVVGTHFQQKAAFITASRYLKNRITAFLALPLATIDRMALSSQLRDIGRLDGATAKAGETK
jgi:ArsR family transcriptional regulator, arsenate/arsenite/antimonite-responsive transcriptional repressor / arsenate reductase (thioredoxin)